MKNLLLFILWFTSFASLQAQDAYLFDRDWYLHELHIDNTDIEVPILPANPPTDCIFGILFDQYDMGDDTEYIIDLGICNMFHLVLTAFDDSTFITLNDGQFTGIGPCYTGSTEMGCTPIPGSGWLLDFEQIYYSFYDVEDITFTYTIETTLIEGDEVTTLDVQKPNGDYALYRETPPLSVASNTLYNVAIYPNPTSDFLTVQLDNQQIKTMAIYTLKGDRINISQQSNTVDVSKLSQGIYFLSLTTTDGKKVVKKFIKK